MTNRDKWEREIETIKVLIEETTVQLRKSQDYTDHTYGDTYAARRLNGAKFSASIKKLVSQRKYRERKLAELGGLFVHRDIFGQELALGCAVAWSTSSKYAGAQMGYIVGVSHKMVQVGSKAGASYGSNVYPKNLIVVDKLIEGYNPQED